MRRKLIAGNWKMNEDVHETVTLIGELKERLRNFRGSCGVVICPPFTSLAVAKPLLDSSQIGLGAQNMSQHDDGAYTGEISARMLKAVGCQYVILGHSERRQHFHETDQLVNAKVKKALANGLRPIICVGETLNERDTGATNQVVATQIGGALRDLSAADVQRIIVAYEPVWAIGTGRNATPEQASDVHRLIRKLVAERYSSVIADELIIQYGGSVNAQNAGPLFAKSDIDGGLVGGASLKVESFVGIIQAAVAVGQNGTT